MRVATDSWSDISLNSTTQDIDNGFQRLGATMRSAAADSIEKKTVKYHSVTFSNNTLALIKEKNRIKRSLYNANTTADMDIKRAQLKIIQLLLDNSTERDRDTNWAATLEKANGSPKKFWSLTKNLRSSKNKIRSIDLHIDNNTLTTSNEKSEAFKAAFAEAHCTFNRPMNHEENRREADYNQYLNEECDNQDDWFNMEEITSVIRLLKNGKAAGFDGLSNRLIKKLPENAVNYLRLLCSRCHQLGHWPKAYKHAKVIALNKPNKAPNKIDNYRPISLLSATSKILERLVLGRIKTHVANNNILPNHQLGFRNHTSATHQATKLSAALHRNKKEKRSSCIVAMDIRKAFDTVPHSALIEQLIKQQFPQHTTKTIASWCSDRTFAVCFEGATSATASIPCGLAQGSCLSPLLYNIYTADIPIYSNNNNNRSTIYTFADDTAAVTTSINGNATVRNMNKLLHGLNSYFDKKESASMRANMKLYLYP